MGLIIALLIFVGLILQFGFLEVMGALFLTLFGIVFFVAFVFAFIWSIKTILERL